MGVVTYPLNNTGYDDKDVAMYNATRSSGVYAGDDYGIRVTGADNRVTVLPGLAWMRISKFHGVAVGMRNEQVIELPLPPASGQRIDAICLQYSANRNKTELIVKPGAEADTPEPPERKTTEAVYELHLYHILRIPTEVTVTSMRVTDKRLDKSYCGIMADVVTQVDTTVINKQAMSYLNVLAGMLKETTERTIYELKRLNYTDVTVPVSAWEESEDIAKGTYRAEIELSGVTSGMDGEVVFYDADKWMFSANAETYNGGVYIYANTQPDKTITIPNIRILR